MHKIQPPSQVAFFLQQWGSFLEEGEVPFLLKVKVNGVMIRKLPEVVAFYKN
jgi:hypothetical protein